MQGGPLPAIERHRLVMGIMEPRRGHAESGDRDRHLFASDGIRSPQGRVHPSARFGRQNDKMIQICLSVDHSRCRLLRICTAFRAALSRCCQVLVILSCLWRHYESGYGGTSTNVYTASTDGTDTIHYCTSREDNHVEACLFSTNGRSVELGAVARARSCQSVMKVYILH